MPAPSTRYQEAREFPDAYAASKADRLRQLAANDDPVSDDDLIAELFDPPAKVSAFLEAEKKALERFSF